MWEWLQKQIDRLMGDVEDLKGELAGTDAEVIRVAGRCEEVANDVNRIKKVQDYQGVEIEAIKSKLAMLEDDIHSLRSKYKGKAIEAGKAKAKNERMRAMLEELKKN